MSTKYLRVGFGLRGFNPNLEFLRAGMVFSTFLKHNTKKTLDNTLSLTLTIHLCNSLSLSPDSSLQLSHSTLHWPTRRILPSIFSTTLMVKMGYASGNVKGNFAGFFGPGVNKISCKLISNLC